MQRTKTESKYSGFVSLLIVACACMAMVVKERERNGSVSSRNTVDVEIIFILTYAIFDSPSFCP